MLCRKGYDYVYTFRIGKEYEVVEERDNEVVVKDEHNQYVTLNHKQNLLIYFYTKEEYRKIKIDKLLASI